MIAFIDDHREVHGVEPICKVLPIALSTYQARGELLRIGAFGDMGIRAPNRNQEERRT